MVRAALRRLLVILAVVVGTTAAISAALGGLAGANLLRALAVGYYLAGAGVLFGSLVLGMRGPMRVDREVEGDRPILPFGAVLPLGRRKVRKATLEERRGARLSSVGLFAFGVLLVLLGAVLDPSRRAF